MDIMYWDGELKAVNQATARVCIYSQAWIGFMGCCDFCLKGFVIFIKVD